MKGTMNLQWIPTGEQCFSVNGPGDFVSKLAPFFRWISFETSWMISTAMPKVQGFRWVQGEMEEFLSSEQSWFHDEIVPKNIWIAFHSLYKSMKKIEWD